MPYKIKCTGKNQCKVYSPSGAKSKKPMSKAAARQQQRALYANAPDKKKK